VGHAESMSEMGNANEILVGNPEWKLTRKP